MTNELQNSLLKENIQCIDECDGKYIFFRAGTVNTVSGQTLNYSSLFAREIPVGSILIVKSHENGNLKLLVFVCCNASQSNIPTGISKKNNLFWVEMTPYVHYISPK